jgi:hypothetical protein
VIGNKIVWLLDKASEFLDAVVTMSEQDENVPAYLMGQQFEERRQWKGRAANGHKNPSILFVAICFAINIPGNAPKNKSL